MHQAQAQVCSGVEGHTPFLVRGLNRDFADSTILTDHAYSLGQIKFAQSGAMVVSSADGNWVVAPTRALWLAPHVRYRIRMMGKVQLRSVFVNAEVALRLPARSCLLPGTPLLREIVSAVTMAANDEGPGRRIALLLDLLLEEINEVPGARLNLPSPRDYRLANICTYIQEHLDDTKSLKDWGRELGYDPRTLHRLFQHELGMSFLKWREHAKLLAALEWLNQGRPVLTIALDLGYQTQSAFTAMFRRNLGTTPSEFLKE